jgi:hypothetical protein
MCSLGLFGVIITDLNDNKPVFVFPPDNNPPADPYQLRIRKVIVFLFFFTAFLYVL